MKNTALHSLTTRLAAGLFLVGSVMDSQADIISDWTSSALEAIRSDAALVPQSSRDLAMLHTAIYNAVEGISGDHYLFTSGAYSGPSGTAPTGASLEAATAAAANTILQSLYPSMGGTFSTLFTTQISSLADDQARLDGINFGTLVANDILNWRSGDGSLNANDPGLYTQVGTVGHWQPNPPAVGSSPGWGNVTTFGINGTAGYTGSLGMANGDYVKTAQYAADYNQVKDLGSASSGLRTADQLNAAYFWEAAQGTITTAGMWNEVAQTVAASAGLSLQEKSRLYAALNIAMADAAIVTWDTKYDVDFWNPLLAIVNGGADDNAATIEDINWQSLLNSPDFPTYFSEHGALSAAAAEVLARFLGDTYAFSLSSDTDGNGTPDMVRNFNSFSEAVQEAIDSQIWGGVAFGTSNADSVTAGANIGDYILDNYFAPVPEPSASLMLMLGGLIFMGRRQRRA